MYEPEHVTCSSVVTELTTRTIIGLPLAKQGTHPTRHSEPFFTFANRNDP